MDSTNSSLRQINYSAENNYDIFLQALTTGNSQPSVIIDPTNNALISANEPAAQVWELDAHDLLGIGLGDLFIPASEQVLIHSIEKCINQALPQHIDIVTKNINIESETPYRAIVTAVPTADSCLIYLNMCISTKKIQQELVRKESELRLILDNIPGLVAYLSKTCTYRTANQAYLNMFKLTSNEIRGKHISEVLTEQGWRAVKPFVERALKGERVTYEVEVPFASGRRFVDMKYVPDIGANGVIEGFFLFGLDIHDRKVAEGKLIVVMNDLARSNKDLMQFAFSASHDLQEPLKTIGSYVDVLQKRMPDLLDDRASQCIQFITSATTRMREMIQSLLELSSLSQTHTMDDSLTVSSLVEDSIADLEELLSHSNATIEVNNGNVGFHGNSHLLQRLIQNIVSNAIKFQTPGVNPVVTFNAEDDGDFLTISVEDNGIGIAQEYKDTVFDMFKRLHTRHEYEGTGLGLAVCRKIIEFHKGDIWIDSEQPQGSTVYFTLCKKSTDNE